MGHVSFPAIYQLGQNGAVDAVSPALDSTTDVGDTGFPDSVPGDFAATSAGAIFVSAWSRWNGMDKAPGSTYGDIQQWSSTNNPGAKKLSEFGGPGGKGLGYVSDFAISPAGAIYACGAVATGRPAKSSVKNPRGFRPAVWKLKFP
jgi:hypothetical protein